MKCKICNDETLDHIRNQPICKKCRNDIYIKRDNMVKEFKEKEEAFLANPTNNDLLSDLSLTKRGSITEALQELTKEKKDGK